MSMIRTLYKYLPYLTCHACGERKGNFIALKKQQQRIKSKNASRVKNCAQIPARARNIALLYNACTRNISPIICALIRRITGASAWANYRIRTRITLYARIRVPTHTRAPTPLTLRARGSTRCGWLRLA